MRKTKSRKLILGVKNAKESRDSLETYISLAEESFKSGLYELVMEYCGQITKLSEKYKYEDIACQGYYLGCLSALKKGDYERAGYICGQAREQLGEYLDIIYFEILIAAVKGNIADIPDLAAKYVEVFDSSSRDPQIYKVKTCRRIGEVLLMWGQALEQLHESTSALNVYEKYLEIYPEDRLIAERLALLVQASIK